jgi:hypothetical protein
MGTVSSLLLVRIHLGRPIREGFCRASIGSVLAFGHSYCIGSDDVFHHPCMQRGDPTYDGGAYGKRKHFHARGHLPCNAAK